MLESLGQFGHYRLLYSFFRITEKRKVLHKASSQHETHDESSIGKRGRCSKIELCHKRVTNFVRTEDGGDYSKNSNLENGICKCELRNRLDEVILTNIKLC